MSKDDQDDRLLKQINEAGFVFQIGVADEIDRTTHQHGWKVVAEEHHWSHHRTGENGFMDLVVQHETNTIFRLLIECKRVREDTAWVFLTPQDHAQNVDRMSLFWSANGSNWLDRSGWVDLPVHPPSPEAAFCTIHGQGDGARPMLERIADDLLPGTEAIGIEEQGHVSSWGYTWPLTHLYLPAIVTNATLYTATFDPSNVGMDTGRLSAGDCEFREVPYVRFRKGLRSPYHSISGFPIAKGEEDVLRITNLAAERGILILNASSLSATLRLIGVHPTREVQFNMILERMHANRG